MIECAICLDTLYRDMKELECGHKFHKLCIDAWFSRGTTCPLCRSCHAPITVIPIAISPRLPYHTTTTQRPRISRFRIIAGTVCILILPIVIIPLYMFTR